MYVTSGTLAIVAIALVVAIIIVYSVLSARINKLHSQAMELAKLTAEAFDKTEEMMKENRSEGLRNTADAFEALSELAKEIDKIKK